MTAKQRNKSRRALLAVLLAGSTMISTGCATSGFSFASLNPFSATAANEAQSPTAPPQQGTFSKMSDSIANSATGARNQVSTMGTTIKSAWGKTTGAVTGLFAGAPADGSEDADSSVDPLRLDNKQTIGAEVLVANGQLWESTGNQSKAMESYVQALQAEPGNGPAMTAIARLHFRQGNHQQAAEFFQKALTVNPQDAGLHNDLGLTLSKLGNHTAATQSLNRALQLAPGTSRYANNLASVQFAAGNTAAAQAVLMGNNKPAVAHFNMAYLHFKKGQLAEARGQLAQAMQFESQAEGDSATKQAVDRSRDMLAQIDGTLMKNVAQATPGANTPGTPSTWQIQQTSQAATQGATSQVAPASARISSDSPATTSSPGAVSSTGAEAPTTQFSLPPGFNPSGL